METQKSTKRQMLRYVGNISQLFGIKEYTLSGGRASGVKAVDVKTGAGLEFTVIADRCMDIAGLSFNGTNCSYLNKTGMVSPEYYEKDGVGFLRNFFGGFLTTCGLRNVGAPCEDEGESFPLHGRISNIPAEEFSAITEWIDDVPVMTISGKMKEARMFGENLVLTRKITCRFGENKIHIQNSVENCGFKREGLMLLFHFNLGYPLLDEDAVLVTPTGKLIPRDAEAVKGAASYNQFQTPTPGYAEQVFYHDLKKESTGETAVALVNRKLGLGAALHYNKNQIRNFIQWKQMGEGEYVLGMEPANCLVAGRAEERKNGTLEYLEPGEIRNFDLVVELVSGTTAIDELIAKIESLQD
jgi:hypothetical protein